MQPLSPGLKSFLGVKTNKANWNHSVNFYGVNSFKTSSPKW